MQRTGLATVVASTMAMQAVVVMASLTAPVLASVIAPDLGLAPHLVGYYSALIYGLAALTSLTAPRPIRRFGVIRLHQLLLLLTASGLMALALGHPAAFVLSGTLIGIAYGPINPASTVLLARFAPPHTRARIFSLKQTAVPIGGALAGSLTPQLALALGWRGAALVIAAVCVLLAFLVQPCRAELDEQSAPIDLRPMPGFGQSLRLLLATPALRELAAASFVFGAVQFSFSATFPTLLSELGWGVVEAGSALSIALALSIGSRVFWGWIADIMAPRRVLAGLGLLMTGAATATALAQPGWPRPAMVMIAATFGISASTWNGIAIADVVRAVRPENISAASAAAIALTFAGAVAGPLLFSLAMTLTGTYRPFFVLIAAAAALPSCLLLRAR